MTKKNALGRGLGALIEDAKSNRQTQEENASNASSIDEIDISKIEVNPFQPRRDFDQAALEELAESIKQLGIIQPITVRKVNDNKYQLISGERRFRAAKIAGLTKLPTYIRSADDQALLEFALVENIQREDLNAIEVAISYQRLIDECALTQENLSERLGKKRSTIANFLRLLKLPAEIQLGVKNKKITVGHAKILVNIEDVDFQNELFDRIVKEDLSVRRIEEIVRLRLEAIHNRKFDDGETDETVPEHIENFKKQLSETFKNKIELRRNNKGAGKIVIPFRSDEELNRIIDIIGEKNR